MEEEHSAYFPLELSSVPRINKLIQPTVIVRVFSFIRWVTVVNWGYQLDCDVEWHPEVLVKRDFSVGL